MEWNIAILGFGNVGQGFLSLLHAKKELLAQKYGFRFKVVAISDPLKGNLYNGRGLSLDRVITLVKEKGSLEDYEDAEKGWDSLKTIEDSNCNVVAEATPTNLKTGEPGKSHILRALSLGKHVITTNKGPIALYYHELSEAAKKNRAVLRFEGTVLSGTPSINLSLETLAGSEIREIRGIVNGTTNFILTEMAGGKSYDEALKEAQRLGYAETDPTADVEGWDAVAKVMILGNVVMGGKLRVGDIKREGITKIDVQDIERAKSEGKVIKLIARVTKEGPVVRGRVSPEEIGADDFLSQVKGAINALTFTTDTLGEITIIGPGAGRRETGFSLLNDLIHVHNLLSHKK